MEETEIKIKLIPKSEKEEIDWAKLLDYTRFLEPAEINNPTQELYKKDFEKKE